MRVTIRKIGNSEGIIIPRAILSRMGLKVGDTMQICENGGAIALRPEQADLERQMKAARIAMNKYRVALCELTK